MRVLALTAIAALSLAAPAAAQETLIVCTSPGVIDGDTFRCDGALRIRLWGIDAPERHAPGGPAATKALARLTTGKTLVCRRKGKSYERVVAQCWIGPRDLAAELVRQGHAADLPKYSRGHYARR